MSEELFEREKPVYDTANFPPARDFQTTAHEALRDGARQKHRCQLIMAPTGAGKSYLGLRIIHEALLKGRTAMFVCDRRTLINQTSETADRYGLKHHGIIQADHWRTDPLMPFQIASAQTLASRGWPAKRPDVVVIDEAHTQLAAWVDYIKECTEAGAKTMFIGLSATPFSKGLGKSFTNLINATTMHELTEAKVLVPMRVFSGVKPNMKGAKTSDGEWTDGAAAERGMEIIGDVVREYIKNGEGRKAICFGATIAHCEEICRQFNEAGIMAGVFCSTTSDAERLSLLTEYRKVNSALRVLVSVEALAKGFDVQDVGCVIDCRPLKKSLSTAIQMWGRGLRSSPETGKLDAVLLDHSGNFQRFLKDFEQIYYYGLANLDDGERLDKEVRGDEEEDEEPAACPKCGYKPMGKKCLACGHEKVVLAKIEHEQGELREITLGKKKMADDSYHLWKQVTAYMRTHGNQDTAYGRACHTYKRIAGEFPPKGWRLDAPMVPITANVLSNIRANAIRFAKGKAKG